MNIFKSIRKTQILFMLLFSFIVSSQAKKVTSEQALSVAQRVVQQQTTLRNARISTFESVHRVEASTLRSSGEQENVIYYYVYNLSEDQGFVVVAGDDVCVPVIAYATSGSYNAQDLPEAFSNWMEGVCRSIDDALENNLQPSEETVKAWENYLNGTTLRATIFAGPLIQTKWDQSSPYNDMCPKDNSVSTLTGCVATTMAQIMKYYQYPLSGIGTTKAYVTPTDKLSVPVVDLSAMTYDWEHMIDSYKGTPTPQEKSAVATLMYHCGVATDTDYGTAAKGGSASNLQRAAKAFRTYFDYDKSLQIKLRSYYDDSSWSEMIKDELNAHRPVFYSGTANNGEGHAFVVDGYDSDGNFHVNWGWSGSGDAFLNFNAQSHTYVKDNRIAIRIKPNNNETETYDINLYPVTNLLTESGTNIKTGDKFAVSACYYNTGCTNFDGLIKIVLTNGTDIYTIGSESYAKNVFPAGAYYVDNDRNAFHHPISCTVPDNVPSGEYQIKAMTEKNGKESFVSASVVPINYIDFIDVTVQNLTSIDSPYSNDNLVSVYPNQDGTQYYIQLNEDLVVKGVKVVDLYGRTIKNILPDKNEKLLTIPVNEISSGVYVVSVETDRGVFSQKIVKK